jgi:hypothetical protein
MSAIDSASRAKVRQGVLQSRMSWRCSSLNTEIEGWWNLFARFHIRRRGACISFGTYLSA